jgi:hypothetical protein
MTRSYGYDSPTPRHVSLFVMALGLSAPIWVLLLRRMLWQRVNPNATYPRPGPVPPGTPPALIETRNADTGELYLTPVPRAEGTEAAVGGVEWATFRPGQVVFPEVCCVCLDGATTGYAVPFSVNSGSEVPVPLCPGCAWDLKKMWWLAAFVVGLLAAAISAGIALAIPKTDEVGRWILFTFLTVFAVPVAAAVIPAMICRPYRLRTVDGDRGVVRFRAKNPAYTQLVAQQAREADGLA